jgi:hypothetical protein
MVQPTQQTWSKVACQVAGLYIENRIQQAIQRKVPVEEGFSMPVSFIVALAVIWVFLVQPWRATILLEQHLPADTK